MTDNLEGKVRGEPALQVMAKDYVYISRTKRERAAAYNNMESYARHIARGDATTFEKLKGIFEDHVSYFRQQKLELDRRNARIDDAAKEDESDDFQGNGYGWSGC